MQVGDRNMFDSGIIFEMRMFEQNIEQRVLIEHNALQIACALNVGDF